MRPRARFHFTLKPSLKPALPKGTISFPCYAQFPLFVQFWGIIILSSPPSPISCCFSEFNRQDTNLQDSVSRAWFYETAKPIQKPAAAKMGCSPRFHTHPRGLSSHRGGRFSNCGTAGRNPAQVWGRFLKG